jgi:hypothetical protein
MLGACALTSLRVRSPVTGRNRRYGRRGHDTLEFDAARDRMMVHTASEPDSSHGRLNGTHTFDAASKRRRPRRAPARRDHQGRRRLKIGSSVASGGTRQSRGCSAFWAAGKRGDQPCLAQVLRLVACGLTVPTLPLRSSPARPAAERRRREDGGPCWIRTSDFDLVTRQKPRRSDDGKSLLPQYSATAEAGNLATITRRKSFEHVSARARLSAA